jgi:hypothetical protein
LGYRRDRLLLPSVPRALVSDIADIVWIETFRSAPLVDGSGKFRFSSDRTFCLRSGLVESSPGTLIPQTAHRIASCRAPAIPPQFNLSDAGDRYEKDRRSRHTAPDLPAR